MPKTPATDAPFIPQVDAIVRSLIPRYLENRRQDPARIEAALAAGDFTTVRRLGHDLRGTGGAYGLPPVTEFGALIEQAALEQDAAAVRAALKGLVAFLDRVVLPEAPPPAR